MAEIGKEIYSYKYKRFIQPDEEIYLTVMKNYYKYMLKSLVIENCGCTSCMNFKDRFESEIQKITEMENNAGKNL